MFTNNNFEMKLKELDLKTILRVEQHSFSNNKSAKNNKYINPAKGLWLKQKEWPFKSYALLSKVSGISSFPEKKLKLWLLMFLGKRKSKNVLGFFFNLPFLKSYECPIAADVYFNKHNFGILLYINNTNSRVLKFNLTENIDYANRKLGNEVMSQKIANTVIHDKVSTPRLEAVYTEADLYCFEQELIIAKDLNSLSINTIKNIFIEVFDFMFEFYKLAGVFLRSPKENKFIGHTFVNEYISRFEDGDKLVKVFKTILLKNKKMFWGRVHGDLSLNNILLDKNQKIWIIDWGKSEERYLAKDLRSSNYEASNLYSKIIKHFNFERNCVYSLNEQIFIEDFTELSRLVYINITREYNNPSFPEIVKSSIKRLLKNSILTQKS